MNFEIEEIQSYRIAYIRRTGTYGEENIETMEKLKSWTKVRNLFSENAIILAIIHDDPQTVDAENCRYDACIIIPDDYNINDDNINDCKISGGKYIIFKVKHTAEELEKAWMEIFNTLQSENILIDKNKPIIERYKVKMVNNHLCEICVPIM